MNNNINTIMFNLEFIELYNDKYLKTLSLEDETYFTMRDLFYNAEFEYAFVTNIFNPLLSNNIYYEDRTINFTYTNVLNNLNYIKDLHNYIQKITPADVRYNCKCLKDIVKKGKTMDDCFDEDEYMLFDEWWEDFEKFREKIAARYEELRLQQ